MTDILDRLQDAQAELASVFEQLHADNNDDRQQDPHLREAVSATSAALAAVKRAVGHVDAAYGEAGRR